MLFSSLLPHSLLTRFSLLQSVCMHACVFFCTCFSALAFKLCFTLFLTDCTSRAIVFKPVCALSLSRFTYNFKCILPLLNTQVYNTYINSNLQIINFKAMKKNGSIFLTNSHTEETLNLINKLIVNNFY